MLVFTDVDPFLQQGDINILTNSPAMKFFCPADLGSIFSQELDI
jgi:hypothetical protein